MNLSTNFADSFMTANIPNTDQSFFEIGIMPQLELLVDELRSWPDNDLVVEKFIKKKEKVVRQIKNVYGGKNDSIYSVLNHCDFHFKNIMFKFDEGKASALQLVDNWTNLLHPQNFLKFLLTKIVRFPMLSMGIPSYWRYLLNLLDVEYRSTWKASRGCLALLQWVCRNP